MLDSTTLEVAIGLVFCYASVALIVSTIKEYIASILRWRSTTLLSGIKTLLNDPGFNGLALNLYNHALVNQHAPGVATNEKDLNKNLPSYIDPKHFATAFIDTIQTIPGNFEQLKSDIENKVQDPQLKQLLLGIHGRAANSIDTVHDELAAWFDAGMDRLSGSYKRRSQLWCFIIALLIAATFNIDSFHLFKTLWQHPALTAGISAPAGTPAAVPAEIPWEQFKTLPIGWAVSDIASEADNKPSADPAAKNTSQSACNTWLFRVAGWVVTALATLFGAPFWFDLLGKLVNLRGTGNKPGPVSKPTANESKS